MNASTRTVGLVAAGGAVGAGARYALVTQIPVRAGSFPTTTLLINVAGAFALGLLVETVVKHDRHAAWARPLLGIGLVGAFTTFSSMATEAVLLLRDAHAATAAAYLLATIALGIPSAAGGLLIGGWRPFQPVPDEGES